MKRRLLPVSRSLYPGSWSFVTRRLFAGVLLFVLCASSFATELPFPIGEELTYSIRWNGIPVAWSTAKTEMDTLDGRDVIALRMRTRTYPFFNWVFKVNDLHESLVDPVTLRPIRYTKNLREGRYRCHEVTEFDFDRMRARYEHQTNGNVKEYAIESDTRDILSFMYFLRGVQLKEQASPAYRVMSDEKLYDLILHGQEIESVELDGYECEVPSLRIQPETLLDGLCVRKGEATVWISRDARGLLTAARIHVPFGRAQIELESVRGPGDDFWITERKADDDDEE